MAWENWKTSDFQNRVALVLGSAAWTAFLLTVAHTLNLNEPYLPLAVAGGFIFFFRNSPSAVELTVWASVSVALRLAVRFPQTSDWVVVGSSALCLFGLGAFLMFGLRWMWSEPQERRRVFATFAPAASLFLFVFGSQRVLSFANLLYPKTYDLYLYAFDGAFGFQPSFLMGRAMAGSFVLRNAALITYVSLPFVMALVYALSLRRGAERPSWNLIFMFLLAGFGGWALYNIVPACGPVHAFGADFPRHPLPYRTLSKLFLEPIPIAGDVPRNAIPSLHLAWVLLLVWNSWRLSRTVRIFLVSYLALTVVATMGTGEHYFVDLVAGIPLALTVQIIALSRYQLKIMPRVVLACSALALTFMWLLLARFGIKLMLVSPFVPWSIVVVTGIATWLILSKCSEGASPAQPVTELAQPESSLLGASSGDY